MTQPLVELQNLKKHFPIPCGFLKTRPLRAVDGVDLKLYPGETLGLVGESGCGKSTLGRTLMHLYPPSEGRVFFQGQPIDSPQALARFRRKTAMVFQDPYASLNPRMTVADLIGEPLDIHRLCKTPSQRQAWIHALMDQVGLRRELETRYPHAFSGGQRQRIGIARALASEPEFIVCDEPVSALDVSIQAQIINLFARLREELGLTCLFIAHDLLVVQHICHRIAVMYLGRIVELGSAREVYSQPLHPYCQILLSAVPIPDPARARARTPLLLTGELPSPMDIPSGCPFRTRCPYARDICVQRVPELREYAPGHLAACHFAGRVG